MNYLEIIVEYLTTVSVEDYTQFTFRLGVIDEENDSINLFAQLGNPIVRCNNGISYAELGLQIILSTTYKEGITLAKTLLNDLEILKDYTGINFIQKSTSGIFPQKVSETDRHRISLNFIVNVDKTLAL